MGSILLGNKKTVTVDKVKLLVRSLFIVNALNLAFTLSLFVYNFVISCSWWVKRGHKNYLGKDLSLLGLILKSFFEYVVIILPYFILISCVCLLIIKSIESFGAKRKGFLIGALSSGALFSILYSIILFFHAFEIFTDGTAAWAYVLLPVFWIGYPSLIIGSFIGLIVGFLFGRIKMHSKNVILLFIMIGILSATSIVSANESIKFNSGTNRVMLVELFTSQGCSSSPPGGIWLNKFMDDPRLWKEVVPVSFHVDYWDYIGWKDPYSSKNYSSRQRDYRARGYSKSVYTPGFFVNGSEWRGWFNDPRLSKLNEEAGELNAVYKDGVLKVEYSEVSKDLLLNVAVLGVGIKTNVLAGENRGRKLDESFVVLYHKKHASSDGKWEVSLKDVEFNGIKKLAIALWVHPENDLVPLQATGGWL